jgi:hypothetical protein
MSTQENEGDRATQGTEQDARQTSPPAQNAVLTTSAEQPAHHEHHEHHEPDLVLPPTGSRYFGTGSYEMGGTHAEGSDAVGDLNPVGGYGTFNDAGGPGSTTLYGEEAPVASQTPEDGDATDSPQPPPVESTSRDP